MDRALNAQASSEILVTHLMEGIGIAVDLKGNRMHITDFGGSLYSAKLDGSDKKTLLFFRSETSPASRTLNSTDVSQNIWTSEVLDESTLKDFHMHAPVDE